MIIPPPHMLFHHDDDGEPMPVWVQILALTALFGSLAIVALVVVYG